MGVATEPQLTKRRLCFWHRPTVVCQLDTVQHKEYYIQAPSQTNRRSILCCPSKVQDIHTKRWSRLLA